MKKSFFTKLFGLLIIPVLFLINVQQIQAQTQAWDSNGSVCVSENDPDVATLQGLQCLVANVLSVFLTLVGMAGFVMLIVASFQWMTSGGNSQAVEKSKKTITFAILGIVLALSSFMILNLISQFTGIETILNFKIPGSDKIWN